MAAGALPHRFRLAADDLKRIIDKTRFAISTEETRYYLNGIYLHAAKDAKPPVMRAVATDGHRLARFELELPDGADQMPGVIVPRKTVGELRSCWTMPTAPSTFRCPTPRSSSASMAWN